MYSADVVTDILARGKYQSFGRRAWMNEQLRRGFQSFVSRPSISSSSSINDAGLTDQVFSHKDDVSLCPPRSFRQDLLS